MRTALLLVAVLALILSGPVRAGAATPAPRQADGLVAVGEDVTVTGAVERVVVLGGDLTLTAGARVQDQVIVLFGTLHRAPGAQVGGAVYVLDRSLIGWIPGPGWVEAVVLILCALIYRAVVWAAVAAIAATLVRTAAFEWLEAGWRAGPGRALAAGLVAVVLLVPAITLVAATGFLLPLALVGLAGLLIACGAGLALFREGPLWPRRPRRALYIAYLLLPPALEIGLLLTAAGGIGAALRAIGQAAARRGRPA
jgi:hypothetical protein